MWTCVLTNPHYSCAELCTGAVKPRIRPFAIYDATISYPLRGDTIPAWVAFVVPFGLMLISLCIGELVLFKRVRLSYIAASSCYDIMCGVSAHCLP